MSGYIFRIGTLPHESHKPNRKLPKLRSSCFHPLSYNLKNCVVRLPLTLWRQFLFTIDIVGFCTGSSGSSLDDRIWTCNPLLPKQVLCQIEPHPDIHVRLMDSWFTMDINPKVAEFLTLYTTNPASPRLSWGLWTYIPHQSPLRHPLLWT